MPNKYFFAAFIWTIIVAFLCLESTADLPSIGSKFKGLDKIVHATFHFIFTMLWFLFFKNKNHTFKKSLAIAFTIIQSWSIPQNRLADRL